MKKIISIIVLSIVGLLVAATITLAIVPVSTYDAVKGATLSNSNPDYMIIYRNGNSNTLLPSTREDYNTIYNNVKKNHEKSLQASVLSSFFQGAMSYTEEVEKATTSNIENVLKTKSETGSDPTMYIEFAWYDAQTLYFEGEQYKVTNNKTEKTVTFTSLAIEVKNNNAFNEITIYVIDSSSSSSRVSNYKIHTLAHQEDLYKYMLTLEIKGTLGA